MLSLELAHGLFGFEPTFDSLAKGCHGSGGFSGVFFWSPKSKRKVFQKNLSENPPPENKKSPGTQPRKTTGRITKSAAKSTDKSGRQTSKRTLGFLRLRRFAPGGAFRAHFWVPSGPGRGSRAEMHLRSQTLLFVKGVCFDRMAQISKKSATRLPILAAQHFILS